MARGTAKLLLVINHREFLYSLKKFSFLTSLEASSVLPALNVLVVVVIKKNFRNLPCLLNSRPSEI